MRQKEGEMLLFTTILAAIVMIAVIKFYSTSEGRIPPISSRRGKEARIVAGFILICFIILLVLNASKAISDKGDLAKWILIFMVGGIFPIWNYIQFKKNNKKGK